MNKTYKFILDGCQHFTIIVFVAPFYHRATQVFSFLLHVYMCAPVRSFIPASVNGQVHPIICARFSQHAANFVQIYYSSSPAASILGNIQRYFTLFTLLIFSPTLAFAPVSRNLGSRFGHLFFLNLHCQFEHLCGLKRKLYMHLLIMQILRFGQFLFNLPLCFMFYLKFLSLSPPDFNRCPL